MSRILNYTLRRFYARCLVHHLYLFSLFCCALHHQQQDNDRMMNPSSSSISDTIIDNTVVFPSLVEYIESIRFLPLEEQARRITDPVTQKRITFPLYCLGKLWERKTIKDLLSDATTTRNGYFLHPVTGQQVSSRIVIDSFPPTANCYIKGVKQLLPPPDDETDDESIEEEVKTMSNDSTKNTCNTVICFTLMSFVYSYYLQGTKKFHFGFCNRNLVHLKLL